MIRPTAPLPDHAARADRGDDLDARDDRAAAQVVSGHQHEPGVVRDVIRCAACAATVRDRDQDRHQAEDPA